MTVRTFGKTTFSVTDDLHPETFTVDWGGSINLVAVGGVNNIAFPNARVSPPPPGASTTETFSLTSINSSVSIASGAATSYKGNIQVWGGQVALVGQKWTTTGVNHIGGGATVNVSVGNGQIDPSVDGNGIFQLDGHSSLEFQYSPNAQINVRDGTLKLDTNWDKQGISLLSSRGEVDLGVGDFNPLSNASYYDIKDDLLIFHDPTTAELGRIAVHNRTNQAIQVDAHPGNGYGLSIVADNTPRPGIIIGHAI